MLNTSRLLAVSCAIALWVAPGSVWAQAGSPPPPDDTGPKPAGVGSAARPAEPDQKEKEEGAASAPEQNAESTGVFSGRPFSGVFGGAAPAGMRKHRLDLSGSLYGVHVISDTVPIVGTDTDLLDDGRATYAGAGASLSYSRSWDKGSLGADGYYSQAYIPDYEDVGDPWIDRWGVAARGDYSTQLGRKVRFGAGATVGYSPYLQQGGLFGGGFGGGIGGGFGGGLGAPTIAGPSIGAPGLDFVVARQPAIFSNGTASLTYEVNRRSSIEGYYGVNHRYFVEGDEPSQYDQLAGARYRYEINRYVGVRAGYGYRTARYGFDDDRPGQSSHLIDAGLDGGYGRSYALARRTTFSFNTGSSIFASDEVRSDVPDDGFNPRARLRIDASADLVHGWARTWSANVGYRRGVGYEVGFEEPLLYDSAFASVGGLLAPRLDFTAGVYYTSGAAGFSGSDNGYDTASAVASLRSAITSNIAAYAQYFYYRSFFESGVTLPSYLQRNIDRQGVTVGLTAWVPLIPQRGRR